MQIFKRAKFFYHSIRFFLPFHQAQDLPCTWPEENYLQIIVCSCALASSNFAANNILFMRSRVQSEKNLFQQYLKKGMIIEGEAISFAFISFNKKLGHVVPSFWR